MPTTTTITMETSAIGMSKPKLGIVILLKAIPHTTTTMMVLTFTLTMMEVMVGGGMDLAGGEKDGEVVVMAAGEAAGMEAGMVDNTGAGMAEVTAVGTVEDMVACTAEVTVEDMAVGTVADMVVVIAAEVTVVVIAAEVTVVVIAGADTANIKKGLGLQSRPLFYSPFWTSISEQ